MPVGPVIVCSGPGTRAIGMNSGGNELGQGNPANSTIGRALQLVVRSRNTPASVLATIRTEIAALDPQMPLVDLQPLASHLGTALLQQH